MNSISVSAMFRFGWETFKKRPGFLILAFLILGIISGISTQITESASDNGMAFVALLNFVVQTFVYMGMYSVALKAHDDVMSVSFKDLWHPQSVLSYFGASILVAIMVMIGIILFIIPGIIAALLLMFVPYFVIDKNLNPIQAIKSSVALAKGHLFDLFLLLLCVVLAFIAGLLALFVGLLVAAPVSMLAVAHAYRTLSGAVASEPVPTPAPTA